MRIDCKLFLHPLLLYQYRLLLLFEFVNILLKDKKIIKKWIGLALVAWTLSETGRAHEGLRVLEVVKFFLGEYFIPLLL